MQLQKFGSSWFFFKYACWAHAVIEIILVVAPALFQQYPDSKIAIQANDILQESFIRRNLTKESISYPPSRIFRCRPCPRGKLDTLPVLPRTRAAVHIPSRHHQRPQAHHDGSVFDRAPPLLRGGIPQVYVQLPVACVPRGMAVGEQVLRNKDILAFFSLRPAPDVLPLRADNHDATPEGRRIAKKGVRQEMGTVGRGGTV